MNKPTFSQNIVSNAKELATVGALFLALNGCGEGKKVAENLQNEEEKGKIEVVLDSNSDEMENPEYLGEKSNANFKELMEKNFNTWQKTALEAQSGSTIVRNNGELVRFGFTLVFTEPTTLTGDDILAKKIKLNISKKYMEIVKEDKDGKILSTIIYEQSKDNKNIDYLEESGGKKYRSILTMNNFTRSGEKYAELIYETFKKLQDKNQGDLAKHGQ